MKNTIITSIILMLCTGCDKLQNVLPKGETTDISVIGDRTDVLKEEPSTDIQPLYGLYKMDDAHLYNGCRLRLRDVADVSIGDVQTVNVGAVSPLLANNNERVAEFRSFQEKVKETFDHAKRNYGQTQNSSLVYSVVVDEANNLSRSDAKNKYLIIFSNMLDHSSDYLDIYQPLVADMMAHHPDQVMQSMEAKMKIESLKGIRVVIVFRPDDHDYHTEKLFRIAKDFYVKLLTKHGAEVVVVPQIDLATSSI
jgi:hypothetical protein